MAIPSPNACRPEGLPWYERKCASNDAVTPSPKPCRPQDLASKERSDHHFATSLQQDTTPRESCVQDSVQAHDGPVIHGRKVLDLLGEGSFGQVYGAWNLRA